MRRNGFTSGWFSIDKNGLNIISDIMFRLFKPKLKNSLFLRLKLIYYNYL